jgi:hypothetical protein
MHRKQLERCLGIPTIRHYRFGPTGSVPVIRTLNYFV